MPRDTRYQGAIVRDHHLLLITHREHATGHAYWIVPGGGDEPGETGEACVAREMLEETGLTVRVLRLLLDVAAPVGPYRRWRTYLCVVEAGEPRPGHEPESEASEVYAISEVRWFDLEDPAGWDPVMRADPFTFPLVQQIRSALGYA